MPTIVGILTFMSRKSFMLSRVEHGKKFYNLGACFISTDCSLLGGWAMTTDSTTITTSTMMPTTTVFSFLLFTIFIRASKTGRIMSCPLSVRLSGRPSVRLSVNFSCPLHNSDIVQDSFMKLRTNINHYQTMRKNKNRHSTYIFMELWPFQVFLMKIMSALYF